METATNGIIYESFMMSFASSTRSDVKRNKIELIEFSEIKFSRCFDLILS